MLIIRVVISPSWSSSGGARTASRAATSGRNGCTLHPQRDTPHRAQATSQIAELCAHCEPTQRTARSEGRFPPTLDRRGMPGGRGTRGRGAVGPLAQPTTTAGSTATGSTAAAATATPPSSRLEMTGISVAFGGVTALSDVSLVVEPGQVHGLIGPNGAGKTTLFNVACGIFRADSGTISWRDRPLRRLRPSQLAGLGIARTLQGVGLFAGLTVLENVMVGAHRHARAGFAAALFGLGEKDERALRARAMTALEELDAVDYAGRYPGSLPYPVQKRVALARALVIDPALLLLDEPASGLSEEEMRELGDLIGVLKSRMSVLLVEHHMDLVMRVCDRVTVLDSGIQIAAGTPAEVQADPAVTEAYLGEQVDAETDAAELTAHEGGSRG